MNKIDGGHNGCPEGRVDDVIRFDLLHTHWSHVMTWTLVLVATGAVVAEGYYDGGCYKLYKDFLDIFKIPSISK